MKYKFMLKKIQYAFVEHEFDSDTTIQEAMNKISEKTEEELQFNEPEFHLELVTSEKGKISKILWKKGADF